MISWRFVSFFVALLSGLLSAVYGQQSNPLLQPESVFVSEAARLTPLQHVDKQIQEPFQKNVQAPFQKNAQVQSPAQRNAQFQKALPAENRLSGWRERRKSRREARGL